LLNSALGLLESSLLDGLPAVWTATGQGSRDAFDAAQMRNATCLCANARALLAGTPLYDAAGYVASNCTGERLCTAQAFLHVSLSQLGWAGQPSSSQCMHCHMALGMGPLTVPYCIVCICCSSACCRYHSAWGPHV
jgi:hypothetical protein